MLILINFIEKYKLAPNMEKVYIVLVRHTERVIYRQRCPIEKVFCMKYTVQTVPLIVNERWSWGVCTTAVA